MTSHNFVTYHLKSLKMHCKPKIKQNIQRQLWQNLSARFTSTSIRTIMCIVAVTWLVAIVLHPFTCIITVTWPFTGQIYTCRVFVRVLASINYNYTNKKLWLYKISNWIRKSFPQHNILYMTIHNSKEIWQKLGIQLWDMCDD